MDFAMQFRDQLNRMLVRYNDLEAEADRYWDRMERYEKEGKKDKAAYASRKMDEIHKVQEGMNQALQIFGYTFIWQDGENKIVEYR